MLAMVALMKLYAIRQQIARALNPKTQAHRKTRSEACTNQQKVAPLAPLAPLAHQA